MTKNNKGLALITGASSGIGAAFAKRLAADGYDLILHGRREEKLNNLANELKKTNNISAEVLLAELSNPEELKKIEEYIYKLERLDLLINNAGYFEPGVFWKTNPDSLEAMIRTHIIAPVRFTRAALPQMLKRNEGAIINVSSNVAYLSPPTVENYSATKAYLIRFTESLHVALLNTKLRIQVLVPGFTLTDMHPRIGLDMKKSGERFMLPEKVVEISLKDLKRGNVVCIPFFRDRLIAKFIELIPKKLYYKLIRIRSKMAAKNLGIDLGIDFDLSNLAGE